MSSTRNASILRKHKGTSSAVKNDDFKPSAPSICVCHREIVDVDSKVRSRIFTTLLSTLTPDVKRHKG